MLEPRLRVDMKRATERLARAQRMIEDMERGREIRARREIEDLLAWWIGGALMVALVVVLLVLVLAAAQ